MILIDFQVFKIDCTEIKIKKYSVRCGVVDLNQEIINQNNCLILNNMFIMRKVLTDDRQTCFQRFNRNVATLLKNDEEPDIYHYGNLYY